MFCQKEGINLRRRSCCRNGGGGGGVATFLLLHSSITFTVWVWGGGAGSKVPFITYWLFRFLSCHARFSSKSLLY